MTDYTRQQVIELVRSKLPANIRNQQIEVNIATIQAVNKYGVNALPMVYQQGFEYTTLGFYSHPNADLPVPQVGGVEAEIKAGIAFDFIKGFDFLTEAEVSARFGNAGISIDQNKQITPYMAVNVGSASEGRIGIDDQGNAFASISMDAGKVALGLSYNRQNIGDTDYATFTEQELTYNGSLLYIPFPAVSLTKAIDTRTLVKVDSSSLAAHGGVLDIVEETQTSGIFNNLSYNFVSLGLSVDDFTRSVRVGHELQGLNLWQANAKAVKALIGSDADGFDPMAVTAPNQIEFYIRSRLAVLGENYAGNPQQGVAQISQAIGQLDLTLSQSDVLKILGNSLDPIEQNGKITVSHKLSLWVQDDSGSYQNVELDPAAAKLKSFNDYYADVVANGTVLSDVTSSVSLYGVTFNRHDVVLSTGNGSKMFVTEFILPQGAAKPANGITRQTYIEEKIDGQLIVARENTRFIDSAGRIHDTVEQKEGLDGNWHVNETLVINGQEYAGETYIVPSANLLSAFQTAGGTVGSFLGGKLAEGNVYKDIVYSTFLKSVGEHFGTFAAYLATDPDLKKALDAAMGASIDGTIFQNSEFSETFFKNLNGKVSSVLGSLIVDKVGDALGIDGVVGEVVTSAGSTITTQFVGETIDVILGNLNGTVFEGISDGLFFQKPTYNANGEITGYEAIDIQKLVINAIAAYAASRLAGEVITPESQQAAIFGSIGSAVGSAIGHGIATGAGTIGEAAVSKAISSALTSVFGSAGSFAPIVGTAIGVFIGQVLGTALGNLFGSDDVPSSWAKIRFDKVTDDYVMNESWGNNGGNIQIAQDMATAVVNGVNSILDLTGGAIRSTAIVPSYQIGMDGNRFVVYANQGVASSFDQSGEAINEAVFHILKNSDLVGGDALLMRAWHNSDATNLYDFKTDLEVAEAFQNYLMDPTAIIAFMLDQPESDLAQSWAAVLKRATELELQLPHEKDLDGSWNELLLARGDLDPSLIPEIDGENIVLVDPETGKETIIHHVIGPGYQIVHMTGTDGNDIIEVIVDGPSIGYVNGGAGNDIIEGSPERDILVGGAGDDEIDGKGGDDWLHGASGNDTVYGNDGNDLVVGGADNDILTDGAGNDTLYSGKGNDKLTSGVGSDSLYGGEGDDELHGGTSNEEDYLYGQEGNDTIFAYGHHNHLVGGQGNDTLTVVSGIHTLKFNRGDGHDVVVLADDTSAFHLIDFGLTISPNELWFQRTGENLVIKVIGENQSITIKDWFAGTVANRPSLTIRVQDLQFEYNGNKDIKAFAQTLVNFYASFAQPTGEFNLLDDATLAQVNVLSYLKSQSSNVVLNPVMAYSNVTEYFFGDATNNNIAANGSSDRAAGGSGNDTIIGGTVDNSNTFFGDSGDDTIKGGHDRDILFGGLGDDILWGESDDDNLSGNYGNDTLLGSDGNDILSGGEGNDTLDGGNGNDTIYGSNGNDIITDSSGVNTIYGDSGDDIITVGSGNDTIYAGSGNDNVSAGAGTDLILGDSGNDYLDGGEGDDTISGGEGSDTLLGGSGSDKVDGNLGDDKIVHVVNGVATTSDVYAGGDGVDTLELRLTAADFANTTIYSSIKTLAHDVRNTLNYASTSTYQATGLGLSVNSIEILKVFVDGNLVEITPDNNRPIANDDTFYLEENRVVLINPLLNDVDPEGDSITLQSVGAALYGTVTINQDSTITYRPNSQTFYGVDYFAYSIQDAYGEKNYGYVNIYFVQPSGNIVGTEADNTISGTSSNESVFAKEGNDIVNAGAGGDSVYGMAGNDILNGGVDNDLLDGGAGNDNLSGGDNNDTIFGGAGNDELKGEAGNDLIYISYGSDILNGGDGTDTINTTRLVERANVNLSTGIASASLFDVSQLSTIENIVAGQFDDILIGSSLANNIQGGAGNDEIRGMAGHDTLYGDAGNDILYGGDGDDFIYGNDGDDIFYSDNGNDQLFGGAGWDKIYFTGNGISIDLRLTTGFSDGHGTTDIISTDFEEVYGSSKEDVIRGQDGVNNILRGEAGNDIVDGNGGDDLIEGGAGNDTLQGGTGIDTVTYERAASGVALNLVTGAENDGDGGQDTFSSLENAIGSNFADNLTGDTGNNILEGRAGDDALTGGAGDDSYVYKTGYGYETIVDTAGNDTIILGEGYVRADLSARMVGNDFILSLKGVDAIKVSNFALGSVVENVRLNDSTLVTLTNILSINGTSGNDTLTGSTANDVMYGLDGNDTLTGGAGNDTIDGGMGTDTAVFAGLVENYTFTNNGTYVTMQDNIGTDGTDQLYGIENVRFANGLTLSLAGVSGWIWGTNGKDTLTGDDNANVIIARDTVAGQEDLVYAYKGDDIIIGGAGDHDFRGDDGNDIEYGGAGSDTLHGNRGDDTLYGEDGDDFLYGEEDHDTIYGGNGVDSIRGDGGNDIIYAGAGNDIKVYGDDGNDTIHGDAGNDVLAGNEGLDTLYGDDGDDKLYGREDHDTLYGGVGNDQLYGDGADGDTYVGNDTLYGEDGIDLLKGNKGDDFLYGGVGNDMTVGSISGGLYGGDGDDTLDGGDGDDTLRGELGNDIYVLSKGADNIQDDGGTADVLKLTNGKTLEDIVFSADPTNSNNLLITIAGETSSTKIAGQNSVGNAKIEFIELEDGFRFDFKRFANWNKGSAGDDDKNGTSGDDIIVGLGGDDSLLGAAGNDFLLTGSGADTLVGGDGNDELYSGDGNDTLYGGSGDDLLYGSLGDDTYFFTSGTDIIEDTGGTDTLTLADNITLEEVTFTVNNNNLVIGLTGAVEGTIVLTNHMLGGTSAIETLRFDDGTEFNLSTYNSWLRASYLGGILNGTSAANFILGDVAADTVKAAAGDDVIYGMAGNDSLHGEAGSDIIHGGSGNDNIYAYSNSGSDTSNDTAYGDDGDDNLYGSDGIDTLYGGNGIDTLRGGLNDDWLYGDAGNDVLRGEDGDDKLYGGYGADSLIAGSGDDRIEGGYGDDSVYAGDGDDILLGESGKDTLRGEGGKDTVDGGAGDDILYGDDNGGYLKDSNGAYILDANGNKIPTPDDNDIIKGGSGNDQLYGEGGDDVLIGGNGLDYLTGGAGSDTFRFTSELLEDLKIDDIDRIKDWGTGGATDKITIEGILIGYDPVNSAISDFVHSTYNGSTTISIDRDGTGTSYQFADMVVIEGKNLNIATMMANDQLEIKNTVL